MFLERLGSKARANDVRCNEISSHERLAGKFFIAAFLYSDEDSVFWGWVGI